MLGRAASSELSAVAGGTGPTREGDGGAAVIGVLGAPGAIPGRWQGVVHKSLQGIDKVGRRGTILGSQQRKQPASRRAGYGSEPLWQVNSWVRREDVTGFGVSALLMPGLETLNGRRSHSPTSAGHCSERRFAGGGARESYNRQV